MQNDVDTMTGGSRCIVDNDLIPRPQYLRKETDVSYYIMHYQVCTT